MPFFRFVYLSQDEQEVVGYPQEAITWVRDLSTYRRTLTQGDEINVNLEHWEDDTARRPAQLCVGIGAQPLLLYPRPLR